MSGAPCHLWLLGLSGSGKSTIAPRLAQSLALPWVDSDLEIIRVAGLSIPEIFRTKGEAEFRKIESSVLENIARGVPSVVACGGGIVLSKANRTRMAASGLRIYLRCDVATLARRLKTAQDRPLLSGTCQTSTLSQQLDERAPWYEESEIRLDVPQRTPEEIVAAIRQKLPAPWFR